MRALRSASSQIIGMKGTAFVHFLCVEMRPAWLVFLSSMDMLVRLHSEILLSATSARLYANHCDSQHNVTDHCSTQDVIANVKVGVLENMWSLAADRKGLESLFNFDQATGHNRLGHSVAIYYNHTSSNGYALQTPFAGTCFYNFTLATFIFVVGCFLMLLCSGATDFSSGAYLAFTWELERRRVYRVYIWLVVVTYACMWVGIALFALFCSEGTLEWFCALGGFKSTEHYVHIMKGARRAAYEFVLPSCMSAYGLYKLTRIHDPGFLWDTQEFKDLRFRRSWTDLFLQENDEFSNRLAHALSSRARPQELMFDQRTGTYLPLQDASMDPEEEAAVQESLVLALP
mmetsp:Transcript_56878/g.166539  ORF Transcript_56878/g.166539 Transcript_56878/m.166539 type:complete len:345 (-) Transcript_56878:99-1133(-)